MTTHFPTAPGFGDYTDVCSNQDVVQSRNVAYTVSFIVIILVFLVILVYVIRRRSRGRDSRRASVLAMALSFLVAALSLGWLNHASCKSRCTATTTTTYTMSPPTTRTVSATEGCIPSPPSSSPLRAVVCRDGAEACARKLDLVRRARRCIVASGNYGGGTYLDSFLEVCRDRLSSGVRVILLLSTTFLTESNRRWIVTLMRTYPTTCLIELTRESVHVKPTLVESRVISNHAKALCIDYGRAFIVGGCGLQSAYNVTGLDPAEIPDEVIGEGVPVVARRLLPAGYRDMDWCFHDSSHERPFGRRLHQQLVRLVFRWQTIMTDHQGVPDSENVYRFIHEEDNERCDDGDDDGPSPSWATDIHSSELHVTSPSHGHVAFLERLVALVDSARTRIVVAHLYIHPPPVLLDALCRAARRGVRIRIVMDGLGPESPPVHHLYVPRSREMCRHIMSCGSADGVSVDVECVEFRIPKCTYHKKVVVVDDWVVAGNGNLGDKSLVTGADDEFHFVVHSPTLAEQTLTVIADDARHSVPIGHESTLASKAMAWTHRHVLGTFIG